jgi:hypothetical protein
MQEFEALRSPLSALGVQVRSVTAQHGDIKAMLSRRGCDLDFVEVISDPAFALCRDYQAKGQKLIFTTEDRPQLLEGLVERDGFSSPADAKHNMVQPGVSVEDSAGNLLYSWSWHDEGSLGEFWTADGKQVDDARKHGAHIVTIRPTAESVLAAISSGSFSEIVTDVYPQEWPREAFPYELDGSPAAKTSL